MAQLPAVAAWSVFSILKRPCNYIHSPPARQEPGLKLGLWLIDFVNPSFAEDLKPCTNRDGFICQVDPIQRTETGTDFYLTYRP